MKKITFRRCTVMAAVFAACLFAVGCKPSTQTPTPKPEPAPNPAPSPAPSPAPAPSIEVPLPGGPSVTPGASVQEEALVGGPVQEETVNVKINIKSVGLPSAATAAFGVVPAYVESKIYSIAVPKSIVDDDLKRAKKMRELLDIKFKSEGIGAYKLYTNADHIASPNAIASDYNFLKNINGVPASDIAELYIAEAKKRIVLPGLHYDATTRQYKEQIMLKPINQIGSAANIGAEPFKTLSEREIDALTKYPVPIEVWNTDDQTARRAAVKDSLKLFLDTKLGLGKYYLFFDQTAADELTYVDGAAAAPASPALFPNATTHLNTYTAWFGMAEADMTVRITIKSITNTVIGDKNTAPALDEEFMPMGDIGTITATVKNITKNESGTNYLVSKALIEAIKAKFPATTAWDSEFMLFSVSAPTDDTNATGDAYTGVERLDIVTTPITDAGVGGAINDGKTIYIGRRK